MFKKAGRFQTETRARRNLRERDVDADQSKADQVRESIGKETFGPKIQFRDANLTATIGPGTVVRWVPGGPGPCLNFLSARPQILLVPLSLSL